MKKLASLICLATMAIVGCNDSSSDSASNDSTNNEPTTTATCERFADTQDVVIDTTSLVNAVTKDRACYGTDGEACDIRMYQIMVGSFIHGESGAPGYYKSWGPSVKQGNLRGIIDNLDYIKSTGVNAIWLTPVFASYPIDGQEENFYKLDGTGYYTSDYFTIDPKWGSKEEMKELVDKAHAKGLRVILDGVFGHAKANIESIESPKGNKLVLSNICNAEFGGTEEMWTPVCTCYDLDKSLPYLQEVAEYWINELKIDGWRLDQAYQLLPKHWQKITQTIKEASANPDNAYKLADKTVQPLGYMVAEVWSTAKNIQDRAFKDDAIESAFDFPTRDTLMSIIAEADELDGKCGSKASELNTALLQVRDTYSPKAMLNTFVTNHDIIRIGDALQRAGYEQDGVEKTDTYYDAHAAIFSFISSVSGPVTVYYGDETGDEVEGFVKTPDNCAELNWCDDHVSRTDSTINSLDDKQKALQKRIATMLQLRDAHPSLPHGIRTHLFSDNSIFVDLKQYQDDKVLYVLNTGTSDRKVTIQTEVLQKFAIDQCTFKDLLNNNATVDPNDLAAKALSGNFYHIVCAD